MKITRVRLYDEPTVPELDVAGASAFVEETFGVPCETRGSFLSLYGGDAARDIAAARIRDLRSRFQRHEPSEEEVGFEGRDAAGASGITYYDGYELQNALGRLVPRGEAGQDVFHVIFTRKMTCTYDDGDMRYHGRALIGSNPSVISSTGIVEAPAKPRDYYLALIANYRIGTNTAALQDRFRGEFLEYGDPRLAKVARGYILQAIFYYETQEAFCKNPDCRLYNAHWQRDLLRTQIEVGRLCGRHREMLRAMTMT